MNAEPARRPMRTSGIAGALLALVAVACLFARVAPAAGQGTTAAPAPPAVNPHLPTLFLIGDSTVRNHTPGLEGWGDPIVALFDRTRINVQNRALGGRSSRSYFTEGLWDKVVADVKPGDFVLMQFGHNDGGPLDHGTARASLKGSGDETQTVTMEKTGKQEVVHTYGWYLRKYIGDAKAKGATPVVLSPVPRNIWRPDNKAGRSTNGYGKWAAEAAKAGGTAFIDLNGNIAQKYDALGPEKVKAMYFPQDHTHTNPAGAEVNAASVAEGIRGLKDCPLAGYLLPASSAEPAGSAAK